MSWLFFSVCCVLVLVLASSQRGRTLNCSCQNQTCPDTSTCPYGPVEDFPCFCCNAVCGLGPDESCGGPLGICSDGYYCGGLARSGASISEYMHLNKNTRCQKGTEVQQYLSSVMPSIQPSPTMTPIKCRTPCNLEFCNEGAKYQSNKFCSANITAFERIPQREPCQHTSCEACRFKVSPECPPCPVPVKKRCLRYFEMCLSEHYARDDIILKLTDPRALNSTGTIICHVSNVIEGEDEGEDEEDAN